MEPVRTTDRGEVDEPVWERADPFGRHATLVSEACKSRPVAGEAGMCRFDLPEHSDVINSRSCGNRTLSPVRWKLGGHHAARQKLYDVADNRSGQG